jgi:hypothetical protein
MLLFVDLFIYLLCHQEPFGLQATLKFQFIEFELVHLPMGMSLRMVLTSVPFALCKRLSRSTPIVTTHVRYLGSEGFDLIPQKP